MCLSILVVCFCCFEVFIVCGCKVNLTLVNIDM